MDIRKELGVNNIKEKVREMLLCWYRQMQRMEENNEVRATVDMIVVEKDQEADGWMASEGICKHCGSPQRIPRIEHSGNHEFVPLTPHLVEKDKEEDRCKTIIILNYYQTLQTR